MVIWLANEVERENGILIALPEDDLSGVPSVEAGVDKEESHAQAVPITLLRRQKE